MRDPRPENTQKKVFWENEVLTLPLGPNSQNKQLQATN